MADEQFGKYRLVRRLAFGGMAEVFLARLVGDAGFRKSVVLKRILPQFSADPDFTRMFIDEAVLAAKLTHPNVAQVYEFGQIEDTYYITMEHVDGADLRKLIKAASERNRLLSPIEVAAIGEGIARGLSYVHFAEDDNGQPLGIVHRDISPHNVMLSRSGDVKIMDFGIAKAAARATQTATGVIKGKMAYMSPEQALGEEVDKLSDQFAVGLVLWECLAGQRLFEGDSEPELMSRVAAGRVRKLKDVVPNVPDALDRVIMRALSIERALRYPDLRDIEQDLSRFRIGLGSAGVAVLSTLIGELIPREPSRPTRGAGTMELPVGEVGLGSDACSDPGVSATARPGGTAELATERPLSPSLSMQSGWTYGAGTEPTRMPTPGNRRVKPFTATRSPEVVAEPKPTGRRRERMLFRAGVATITVVLAVAAVFVMRSGGRQPQATLLIESDPPGAALLVSTTPDAPPLPTGLVTPSPIRGHPVGDVVRWRVEMEGRSAQERTTTLTGGMQREDVVLEKLAEVASTPAPDTSEHAPITTMPAESEPKPTPRPSAQTKQVVKAGSLKKQPAGLLSLRTRGGWVDVLLNQKPLGRAPFDRVEVPVGHLVLELRGPSGVSQSLAIDVSPGVLVERTVNVK